jgi:hypothetical protein
MMVDNLNKTKNLTMINWKKKTLDNIMKIYILNVLRKSSLSYSITKQKLNEKEIISWKEK